MGNWRRVLIEGTCEEKDIPALDKFLECGDDYENFHPLVCGGIFGLPNWAEEKIFVVGNLAERGYSPNSLIDPLETASTLAPSLRVKVHCGDDWEADNCIATVILDENGVKIGPPERETIPPISKGQVEGGLLRELARAEKRRKG